MLAPSERQVTTFHCCQCHSCCLPPLPHPAAPLTPRGQGLRGTGSLGGRCPGAGRALLGALPSDVLCSFSQSGGRSGRLVLFFSLCVPKSCRRFAQGRLLRTVANRGSSGGLSTFSQVCGALAGRGKAAGYQALAELPGAQSPVLPSASTVSSGLARRKRVLRG